jgi:hypothetical protein
VSPKKKPGVAGGEPGRLLQQHSQPDSTLELALRYADAGRKVLPLHSAPAGRCSCGKKVCHSPGKHPRTLNGAKDATTDEARIRAWFERWPNANVGMALDELVVVDVDPRNGGTPTFADLTAKNGPLPFTWTQSTGGGGQHYVFKANCAAYGSGLGPGVDLKSGPNVFIVVEPSVHASGGRYVWLDENGPFESGVLANAPLWLAQKQETKPANTTHASLLAEGGRNAGLSKLAYKMRKSGLSIEGIAAALLEENRTKCTPPLEESEVRTIAAGKASITAEVEVDEFAVSKTARGIMATPEAPLPYLVPQRVPPGLVIIGGRPKSRKSWYALQLGIACTTKRRFMGAPPRGGRALYIALEDNDPRMRQRLAFFGLTPETAPENLHLFYEWPLGLEGAEKIERWLLKYPDTVLVIVDVLARFRGPRDQRQSAYDADYLTMGMLHGIAARHSGLVVLVVHHVRKGAVDDAVEAISGTFAIAGAADAYMILRKGEGEQWIAHVDGRDWDQWDHEFSWTFKQGEGWVQVGVHDNNDLTGHQEEIVHLVRDMQGMTPTTLASAHKIGKSTAFEALDALVKKGALRRDKGKYFAFGE